jgi:hypothetical protein
VSAASSAPSWLSPVLVLVATLVGAGAAIFGQLLNERFKRYRDRQMIARGIAASIDATLLMTDRREYVPLFEGMLRGIDQGKTVQGEKLIEDPSIDPITSKMLEQAGLLGHDLPARIAVFMQVLTGIRTDLVRFGRGEFDGNMPALRKMLQDDLALWREFEPKARLLVRDLRNYANEPFHFWSWQ